MKKIVSLLIVIMLFCSVFVQPVAALVKGDTNLDGLVNSKDVLIIRKHIVGINVNINTDAADYNNDKKINAKDTLSILKHILNINDINYNLTPTIQVNQVGYELNETKVAMLSENVDILKTDSKISGVTCFLVDEKSGAIVYSGASTVRRLESSISDFVSEFDFSSFNREGTYYVSNSLGRSYSFKIASDPYSTIQSAMITALYYNRCGESLDENIVGQEFAHDKCHTGDTIVRILNKLDTNPSSSTYTKYIESATAKASDFEGGLHDAGDYGRYTTPANQFVADLLLTYELYGDLSNCDVITDNENENISDLLDQARYEMKWLLKMQDKTSDGVYWRIATKEFCKYGNRADQDEYFNETGLYVSRVTLKATAGFVGAAALCARVFKDIDPTFASECLNAAKAGYDYVKSNMNNTEAHNGFSNESEYPFINAGAYGDNNGAWSDIWWAACELYRTTGDEKYNNDVKALVNRKENKEISFSYVGLSAYATGGAGSFAYLNSSNSDLSIKEKLVSAMTSSATTNASNSNNDRYKVVIGSSSYYWGSNQQICVELKTMAMLDYINKTDTYSQVIRNNISYIFGRNNVNKSYVTGFGSDSPKDICHAPSAYTRVKFNSTTPVPGWVVGGAIENGGKYEDNHNNYVCNEVCVYWNSSVIFATAYVLNDK